MYEENGNSKELQNKQNHENFLIENRENFVSENFEKNNTVNYFRVRNAKDRKMEKSIFAKFSFLKNLRVGNSKENSYQRTFNRIVTQRNNQE